MLNPTLPEGCIATQIAGQQLWLHPLRAIYWPAAQTLLLADLHLGKTAHFRRAGIAVPVAVEATNLDRLGTLLSIFEPRRLLLLGDLFHSDYNQAWEAFLALRHAFANTTFALVPGNHDILPPERYAAGELEVLPAIYQEAPFVFCHEPLTAPELGYSLAGHLHPGVRLSGNGRQTLRLPCFHFGQHGGVLPAFGAFTGLAMLPVTAQDKIYVIADQRVMATPGSAA